MQSRCFVYLYRDAKGVVRYVGRGGSLGRVESHIDGSHNDQLNKLIATGKFSVEVAGPYDDPAACAAVEAALISANRTTLYNLAQGNGPSFAPLGVPAALGWRLWEPVLSLADLGRMTGGCLCVRLSSGGAFKNAASRQKFDPAAPDDTVIAENVVRYWQLGPLLERWNASEPWPKVVAGLGGPLDRRYIVGALDIDGEGKWVEHNNHFWEVPVTGQGIDSHGLRGRLVDGALFSGVTYGLFLWVDGAGTVRYLPKR